MSREFVGVDERGHRHGAKKQRYDVGERMAGRADRLSLGKHLLEQRQHLRHVQLHILEIEKVLVILLLLEKVIDL